MMFHDDVMTTMISDSFRVELWTAYCILYKFAFLINPLMAQSPRTCRLVVPQLPEFYSQSSGSQPFQRFVVVSWICIIILYIYGSLDLHTCIVHTRGRWLYCIYIHTYIYVCCEPSETNLFSYVEGTFCTRFDDSFLSPSLSLAFYIYIHIYICPLYIHSEYCTRF
jgi:hypothetical protein